LKWFYEMHGSTLIFIDKRSFINDCAIYRSKCRIILTIIFHRDTHTCLWIRNSSFLKWKPVQGKCEILLKKNKHDNFLYWNACVCFFTLCFRRNLSNFRSISSTLNYTDVTKTTEVMARDVLWAERRCNFIDHQIHIKKRPRS